MNRDEAKKLLPVIQAFAAGKDIQFYNSMSLGEKWTDTDDPIFYGSVQWRIKPEPLECWMVRYGDGSFSARKSKELAEALIHNLNGTHTIHHMREVEK